jgi:hypothetical protein
MIDSGIWKNVPFPLNLPLKILIKGFFKVSFAITVRQRKYLNYTE